MSKKILLADDSITIQKVISITFASEDYELTVVGDGDSAVKKAKEEKPDLVMADVAMPGKNGYEVCEAVKSDPSTKKTPVMLLAGTFEPLNKEEALRVKADDSIIKPFESQELLDKVRKLLSKSAAAEPVEAPAKEAPVKATGKPEAAQDVWEAGDFLGFTEEFTDKPDFKEPEAPDLSFLEEEPAKELSSPDQDFTDLEFHEEEPRKKAAAKAPEAPKAPPAPPTPRVDEKKASFEPLSTESFKVEPFEFKTEDIKVEPFEAAPPKAAPAKEPAATKEAEAKPFWAKTEREPEAKKVPTIEQITEPDLLEVPQSEIEAEAVEFVEPVEEPAPVNKTQEPARAGVSEAQASMAIEGAVGRLEEKFRNDLNLRLKSAEAAITQTIENTAAKVEGRLRENLSTRLEKSVSIPKEEVAEIVKKTAKEVIEAVAWEVIPELAEDLIRAEINKVKESLTRK